MKRKLSRFEARCLQRVENDSYRRESLVGDLIEEYQSGRSRFWLWRQIISAQFDSRLRRLAVLRIARWLLWATADLAFVLFFIAIIDSAQELSLDEAASEPRLLIALCLLFSIAMSAALGAVRLKRVGRRTV